MKYTAKELALRFSLALILMLAFGQYTRYVAAEISKEQRAKIDEFSKAVVGKCGDDCSEKEINLINGMSMMHSFSIEAAEKQSKEIYSLFTPLILTFVLAFPKNKKREMTITSQATRPAKAGLGRRYAAPVLSTLGSKICTD